uniref:Uncharacterized protein n=1 Tax=viral metagenome TaxID=1070528 RepID=A0A6C0EBG1_9ZZZZ
MQHQLKHLKLPKMPFFDNFFQKQPSSLIEHKFISYIDYFSSIRRTDLESTLAKQLIASKHPAFTYYSNCRKYTNNDGRVIAFVSYDMFKKIGEIKGLMIFDKDYDNTDFKLELLEKVEREFRDNCIKEAWCINHNDFWKKIYTYRNPASQYSKMAGFFKTLE